MNCFPSRMQHYRLLLLLLLKMPSLPPPRRAARCGAERPPGAVWSGRPALSRPAPSRLSRGVPGGTLSATDPWRHGGLRVSHTVSLPPSHPPHYPGLSPGAVSQAPLRRKACLRGGGRCGCRLPAGGPRASPQPSGRHYCSISPIEAEPSPPSSFPGLYSRLDMLRVAQEQIC